MITSVSPVDGRYASKTKNLSPYFSEYALIKYRVKIEVEYFIALCKLPLSQLSGFDEEMFPKLRLLVSDFSEEDALRIKAIERETNHDVKAVEYFIKEKFDAYNLSKFKEFIHFGLTSQDINNTAIPLSILEANLSVFFPILENIIEEIEKYSEEWKNIPMLARTHGQPASPTTLGKEFRVFSVRLREQFRQLKAVPNSAKFGGATGNFNAHVVSYPQIDWVKFGNEFVSSLGLQRSSITTQIEHYDNIAALLNSIERINTILIDFCRDVWTYISMEYFKQKVVAGEVGSSAMPHKVNPIDFENAEGNLGLANALAHHLASKLPVSRLQRDLTDSTVLRNIGMPYAHSLIAYQSILKGMGKLLLNETQLKTDLDNNWAVVAEAIQNILRRENYPKPYEKLKELTRGKGKITQKDLFVFIESLEVSAEIKSELKCITPHNYIGKINF